MSTLPLQSETSRISKAGARWQQIGAAGGLAYVVLQLTSQALIQVGGAEPPFTAPADEVLAFFNSREPQLASLGGFLSALSFIAFIWFLGALWAALRRGEPEPAWLSLVALASGLVGAAVSMGTGGGWGLALFRLEDGLSPEMARLLFDQGNLGFATLWVPLASLVLAAGVVTLQSGPLPHWLGWFSLLLALGLLVARYFWAASGLAFLPYVLFWLWLIITSLHLIRRARG